MREVEFTIPEGIEPQFLADTFAAYLLGGRAFDNGIVVGPFPSERRLGPFKSRSDNDKWQLDQGNDFFLRIEGKTARLACRYPSQVPVVKAMQTLFELQYAWQRPNLA